MRIMREVLQLANSIEKDIKLTADTPSDHKEKKLPVLDLQMWVEDRVGENGVTYQEIVHEYYEKDMVAPRVISKESALPDKVKLTTLTQEIIRIRKNTSETVREERKVGQMSRFAMKLMLSGYERKERREIILAGLKGFSRLEELDRKGKRSLNRSRKENYEARLLKKHGAKSNWYKRKGESKDSKGKGNNKKRVNKQYKVDTESQIEAVLFVPATPEGELARRIQEGDDRMREGTGERRIKVVERGGETLREMLCRNNPWGNMKCERERCLSCEHSKEGKGGACKRENVVYKIVCLECEKGGTKAEYWGETSRTGYERGEEHLSGLESKYEKNSLWKHSSIHHEGTLGQENFRMEIQAKP